MFKWKVHLKFGFSSYNCWVFANNVRWRVTNLSEHCRGRRIWKAALWSGFRLYGPEVFGGSVSASKCPPLHRRPGLPGEGLYGDEQQTRSHPDTVCVSCTNRCGQWLCTDCVPWSLRSWQVPQVCLSALLAGAVCGRQLMVQQSCGPLHWRAPRALGT